MEKFNLQFLDLLKSSLNNGTYEGGYIDSQGNLVIDFQYEYACCFNEGMGRVNIKSNKSSQGQWGFINKQGEVLIKPTFKSISDFIEGYAQVNESKNNYIDKSGNLILNFKI